MKEARSYRTKQREMVLQFFLLTRKCFCAKELIAQKAYRLDPQPYTEPLRYCAGRKTEKVY